MRLKQSAYFLLGPASRGAVELVCALSELSDTRNLRRSHCFQVNIELQPRNEIFQGLRLPQKFITCIVMPIEFCATRVLCSQFEHIKSPTMLEENRNTCWILWQLKGQHLRAICPDLSAFNRVII